MEFISKTQSLFNIHKLMQFITTITPEKNDCLKRCGKGLLLKPTVHF